MATSLPPALQRSLAERLGGGVVRVRPVSGGCISTALEVVLEHGARVFVKLAPHAWPGDALLDAEQNGLAALRASGTVRVPAELDRGPGWLALEWIEPAAAGGGAWSLLGRRLAELHRRGAADYGFERDNFIGTLPQANPRMQEWAAFWWERRLEPQLERARAAGHFGGEALRAFERLRTQLPGLLAPAQQEGPSLLHGDLWGGNVQIAAEGEPAIIDPAAYRGHREVDLAMAALFGGFGSAFFDAYHEVWPLLADGFARRRAAYQLYYLLVHVNLFGRSYIPQTLSALRASTGNG